MEENSLTQFSKLLLIGGSAGSLEVLIDILPYLPETIDFPIVIVLHRRSGQDMLLEELLASKTRLLVQEVEDKTPLLPGYIYVAPADYHLLFEKDYRLALDISEKINYSRPSIDVSFESAAKVYGAKLTAILLSGANADGTNGLFFVKKAGGTIVVQNPESALMPFMPRNAAKHNEIDHAADAKGILDLIQKMINS
jgi:two-component system, chemotaxis family, protein-glutamate methylesterase/glutaminase